MPYPQGTLGVTAVQPNLGTGTPATSWAGDIGDMFMGHSAYANGAAFGTSQGVDQYNNQASALGAQQSAYDQGQGQAAQQQLQNQGGLAYGTLNALANQYGQTATPGVQMSGANGAAMNQARTLAEYQQAAAGQGPSAAQAQLQSGLDQSIAAQQAGAASTRGGFGLANAQHQAAMNAGQLQGQAANNAAQLRAQEQQAGMAGAAGLGSTMQQQQAANAQYQANLQQQQGQYNAQNQLGAQSAANQQLLGFSQAGQSAAQGWQGMGQNTGLQYNQLGEQALGQQLGADVSNQQSTQQAMSHNSDNQQKGFGSLLSMVGSLF